MAEKPKESRYAAKLRELGFKPYTELLSKEDFNETEEARIFTERVAQEAISNSGLNRQQRRRLKVIMKDPTFFILGEYTYVRDETGVDWGVEKVIDMTPYGFTNGRSDPNITFN